MKCLTPYQKILAVLKQLNPSEERLSTKQLVTVLEHIKQITSDKTTIDLIIKSIKTLLEKDISNTKNLTEREIEVIMLVAKGLKSTVIAKSLNLSQSTIETHRKNIRKKCNLKGNDSLFAFALVFSLQSKSH